MSETCRIGVLAETIHQLGDLKRLVRGAGFSVSAAVEAVNVRPQMPDVDIWVANLDLDSDTALAIVEQLDALNKHVIFETDLVATPVKNGEKPELPADIRSKRERRLAQKLRQWVVPVEAKTLTQKRAQQVWVLAASTGGPEAVAEFLKAVPQTLTGVAFLYAQHIECSGVVPLLKTVARATPWRVHLVDRALTLCEQGVYVVSPEVQIELSDVGTVAPSKTPWAGQFKPSLNQVIAKVARVYGARGGAIVFSGMGDDGANSCTMLRHRGGQVWVQSSDTCTVDSMPVSVAAKGLVHQTAAPKILGQQFGEYQGALRK